MFRSILTNAKNQFNCTALTSGFCTKAPIIRSRREINDVTIVGTLISDSYTLPSGTKQLTIKTQDSPTKYSYHNVHTRVNSSFLAGQRICVTGNLSSYQTKLTDEKSITATTILPTKLFVLDDACCSIASKGEDTNNIRILGNVSNNVTSKDSHCAFSLATHYQKRNEQGEQGEAVDFHAVFAYDENVRQYIQNNLSKSDRVVITGRIGHMTHTLADNKKKFSGYIVAESISKIARRAALQDNSNEREELKQEN